MIKFKNIYKIQNFFLTGSRVVDPDSLNPDPDPDPDPIQIQGFYDKKLKKKTPKISFIFFLLNIAIYLSLCLHKGRPSYRRSLQSSKENIKQYFKI
jgi:hypothetical protein